MSAGGSWSRCSTGPWRQAPTPPSADPSWRPHLGIEDGRFLMAELLLLDGDITKLNPLGEAAPAG